MSPSVPTRPRARLPADGASRTTNLPRACCDSLGSRQVPSWPRTFLRVTALPRGGPHPCCCTAQPQVRAPGRRRRGELKAHARSPLPPVARQVLTEHLLCTLHGQTRVPVPASKARSPFRNTHAHRPCAQGKVTLCVCLPAGCEGGITEDWGRWVGHPLLGTMGPILSPGLGGGRGVGTGHTDGHYCTRKRVHAGQHLDGHPSPQGPDRAPPPRPSSLATLSPGQAVADSVRGHTVDVGAPRIFAPVTATQPSH